MKRALGIIACAAVVLFYYLLKSYSPIQPSQKEYVPDRASSRPSALTKTQEVPQLTTQPPARAAASMSFEKTGELFDDAQVLEEKELPCAQPNTFERVTVLKTDFKYPYLRLREQIQRDAQGREIVLSEEVAVADHILVKLKEELTENDLEQVNRRYNATILKKMLAPNTYLVKFDEVRVDTLPQAVEAYKSEVALVSYAEPDYIGSADVTPSDTYFSNQWGMNQSNDADIDAPEAWSVARNATSILVAVIDSGIDYAHGDLSANMWTNPKEIANNGIDDDANGFIDDVRGWDFVNGDNDSMDDDGHGTHCAGVIGAVGNNAKGVAGVCWSVKLVGIKWLDETGNGTVSDAIDSIYYSTRIGVRLSSDSWHESNSQGLKDAIVDAGRSNILFVCAAGNRDGNIENNKQYPATYEYENMIVVASTDKTNGLSDFSNYGAVSVDLAAPGSSIYSTIPNNQYASMNGTSMATPCVAGACALLMAYFPDLSPLEIRDRILFTVDRLPSLASKCVTGGRLNLYNALTSTNAPPPAGPSSVSGSWLSENTIALVWKDNSTNEVGFSLERSIGTNAWSEIIKLAANTTSYVDTVSVGGFKYLYRLRAFNGDGYSSYSAEVRLNINDSWDSEDDALSTTTTLLSPSSTVQDHGPHTLSSDDLYDWYKISMIKGSSYSLSATNGSGTLVGYLYGGSKTSLVDSTHFDGYDAAGSFMLNYTASATTTYYFKVYCLASGSDAAYTLAYRTIPTNYPPSVKIISPTNGSVFYVNQKITLKTEISDPNDSVYTVAFYKNNRYDGNNNVYPHTHYFTDLALGTNSLKVSVVDTFGSSTSSVVKVFVTDKNTTVSHNDFEGDGISDFTVYHPAAGAWYILQSNNRTLRKLTLGSSTDVPVPADYDGDLISDPAIYDRSTGNWSILQSTAATLLKRNWGWSDAVPVPGDYDGDGKTDMAVYHPQSGMWYIFKSSANQAYQRNWGWSAAVPVPGDYDGDGKTDIAVYHPQGGMWYIVKSGTQQSYQKNWGWSDAVPVPGDYDGDAITDIAVYYPNSGMWYIAKSSTQQSYQKNWGWSAAVPVPGDYDGDGKTDVAVYHAASGNWYVLQSEDRTLYKQNWGWSEATPVLPQHTINRWFDLVR